MRHMPPHLQGGGGGVGWVGGGGGHETGGGRRTSKVLHLHKKCDGGPGGKSFSHPKVGEGVGGTTCFEVVLTWDI